MELNEKRLRTIGHAIATERNRQGLSQETLAAMVGLTSHSHLSRVECGQKPPSMDLIFSLADALGVEVHYFFIDI